MKNLFKNIAKMLLPCWVKNKIRSFIGIGKAISPIVKRSCNICNYKGYFGLFGRPARLDAKCPKCGCLERHRLMMLGVARKQIEIRDDALNVLHFAAEPILEAIFRDKWSNYRTADLYQKADLKLNMEKIELPESSVDLIIANHVLEHVDDEMAGRELSRILSNGGILVCMVPIIEGWTTTYENSAVKSDEDRWLHYGQGDHIRYYGRDFRQRIERGGFKLIKEITAEGEDVIKYGLLRGEKVFVFRKSEL